MQAHTFKRAILAVFLALLAGCGGSTSGGDDGGGGTPPTGGGVVAPGVNLVAASAALPSSAETAAQGVQLTAIVRDANNNVVSGQLVSFSADSGALQVTRATTDMAGTAAAILFTPGDPRNRVISVTATSGSGTDTLQIQVTGTQLSLAGPAAVALNGTATYTVSLTDASGDGIPNQTVMISSASGNTLAMASSATNLGGQAQFTLTGTNPGADTLTATSLGLTAQTTLTVGGDDFQIITPALSAQVPLNVPQNVTLRWLRNGNPVVGQTIGFATTRGTLSTNSALTDASGQATVTVQSNNAGPVSVTASEAGGLTTNRSFQFIATLADGIDVQANPATIGPGATSTVTAVVRDPNNNLVTSAVVNFSLQDTSGGSLRDGSVTTDVTGVASTVYTAGTTSAATPPMVTATVAGSSPIIQDSTSITIGGQALRIVLGTGNELLEPNTTTYQLPYVAIVTDAAGNPAPDANFRLSIRALAYQKGTKPPADTDGDGMADRYVPLYAVGGPTLQFGAGCLSEDANNNGILDAGEDVNNNGQLEPGNPATVPASVTLNPDGTAEFNVTYPQNFSQWVRVRLRATVEVQGTEAVEDAVFVLPVLADDVDEIGVSPPGEISPYGTANNCSMPG